MIKQLAIFVENRPGSPQAGALALHEYKMKIYAFSSIDTPEFGILRMVVDKPEEAKQVLTQKGFVTRVCEVIAVDVEEEQEMMDSLLGVFQEGNISINYTYSSFGRMSKHPMIILHSDDIEETEALLRAKGFHCVDSLEDKPC